MAVVVVAEFKGADQAFYAEASEKVLPGGQLPEGQQIHIAGPIEDGWRVITVWESEEQFSRFREEKLTPAVRETDQEGRVTPQFQVGEIYRPITIT
jgi:hypothetical protein